MNQPQFVIQNVLAAGHGVLRIMFGDGFVAEVNLHDVISKHPTLAKLNDPAVFDQVTPGRGVRR